MTYTSVETVQAIMGKSFDSTTNPTYLEVSGSIIPLADNFVDRSSLNSLSSNDKQFLSTFMTAHIITVSKNVDFRSADISISVNNQSSQWLTLFNLMKQNRSDSFFRIVNS